MTVTINNPNAVNIFNWMFKRKDDFDQIVFLFISQTNATNARYLPLFNETCNVRIVYLRGLRVRYTDRIVSRIFTRLLNFFSFRINQYKVIHIFNLRIDFSSGTQVLHIDDPTYQAAEIDQILKWERRLISESKIPIIICTNTTTYSWLLDQSVLSKILTIEQGFHRQNPVQKLPVKNFSCVYSSPYIHFGNDKLANHSTYGANLLIGSIIPELTRIDPEIEIVLVGKLGKNAKMFLNRFPNVKIFGRVGFERNMEILSTCSVGIYPRTFDHKRSMLKIFTYIGAGLPIVTFDLIDTKVVKDYSLGFSVSSLEEFISRILELKNSNLLLSIFKERVNSFGIEYSWDKLAKKMEILIKQSY